MDLLFEIYYDSIFIFYYMYSEISIRPCGQAPLGLEGSGASRRGRDRDRDLGACRYSRRGLRLRRRGAYGIHRASGPWCQGLCRKVAPHRGNDSLHFVRRSAPSKCVRCASLRSGGRRLAVRTAMEHPIGALTRTPFCQYVAFPLKGKQEI